MGELSGGLQTADAMGADMKDCLTRMVGESAAALMGRNLFIVSRQLKEFLPAKTDRRKSSERK